MKDFTNQFKHRFSSNLVKRLQCLAIALGIFSVNAYAQGDINITNGPSSVMTNGGTFDFGSVIVGSPITNSFILENVSSTNPLSVSSMTITGSDFTSTNAPTTGTTIPTSTATNFDLTFDPTASGLISETITILSDDPVDGTFTFTITGTAIAAPNDCTIFTSGFETFQNGSVKDAFTDNNVVTYSSPSGWQPFLGLLGAAFGNPVNVRETSDARTGSKALELFNDGPVAGDILATFPCSIQHSSLKGYYKFTGAADGDEITISIFSFSDLNNSTVTNTNTLTINADATTYTQFDLPILYDGTSDNTLTILISLTTNGTSSSFKLDDLEFPRPSKPAAPTFSAIANTSVTVNWIAPNDNGTTITGYTLEQKTGAGGTYTGIFTGNALTFDVTGLNLGTEYFYRVKANTANIDSEFSDESAVTTTNVILMSNGALTTCNTTFKDSGGDGNYSNSESSTFTFSPANSSDKIKISFTSFDLESCCDRLNVYDGPDTASPLIANLTGTIIPSDIKASGPGGELTFDFFSDGSVTMAGWEATITCELPVPDKPDPVTTSNLVATTVITSWTAPNDNGATITGYTLEQKEGSDGTFSEIFSGNVFSFEVTGLTIGQEYFYRVKANSSNGDSEFSDESAVTPGLILMATGSATTCNAIFKDPGGDSDYFHNENSVFTFSPEISTDNVKISFTSFSLEGFFDHLDVYDGPDTSSPLIVSLTGTDIPEDITASGSGGTLTFNFVTDGSVLHSGWEASISCAPPVPDKPDAVTFSDVLATSVTVNWTAPNDNGSAITSYTLEQKIGNFGTFSEVYTGNDLTFASTGLSTGQLYIYRVLATNANGNSQYSSESSVTPTCNPVIVLNTPTLEDISVVCPLFTPTAPTASSDCGGVITGISNLSFPIATPGDYVITWSFDNGNGNQTSQLQNITIAPIDNTVTQDGLTLTANASGMIYQWIECGNRVSVDGATGQSFTPTANGQYAVEITDANGFCAWVESPCIEVVVQGVDDQLENLGMRIYPNPVSDFLNIEAAISDNHSYHIVGMSGRVYKSGKLELMIDVSTLTNGIYMMILEDGQSTATFKFLKQ